MSGGTDSCQLLDIAVGLTHLHTRLDYKFGHTIMTTVRR